MTSLKAILANTWATVVLLVVIALCATVLVWHGDLTVEQLKAALAFLALGSGATWLRGSRELPTVVDVGGGEK